MAKFAGLKFGAFWIMLEVFLWAGVLGAGFFYFNGWLNKCSFIDIDSRNYENVRNEQCAR
jgi:hypothetical protein